MSSSDAIFLARYGLIDYSFLLVIEHEDDTKHLKPSINSTNSKVDRISRNAICRESNVEDLTSFKKVYHFGIIDYL